MKNQKSLQSSRRGTNGRGTNAGVKLARPPKTTGPSDPAGSFAQIGFVGLGRMGRAMAINLVAAGFKVMAYVRRPERAAELTALGLIPTTDMRDLFGCRIVITMVTDDQAVRDIFFGDETLG